MKKNYIIFVLLAMCFLAQAQTISRTAISNAGGTLSAGSNHVTYTIGQTLIPSLSAGGKMITQGFQQPGEQIITGVVSSSVCTGSTFTVPFTSADICGENIYTAQLSDAFGSFASLLNIGTLAGNARSGSIDVVIPSNTPVGSGYRIRVVSSSPPRKGKPSEGELTIGSLAVNAGPDEDTYYGYDADQSVTHTATVSGGTAPYTFTWKLDRPLLCNQVNAAGDEMFSSGSGGSCSYATCPSSGSPSLPPSCSGSQTVTVKLTDTANVIVTVRDANGCTGVDTFRVRALDARCFTGSGNNGKVTICHNAGAKWIQLCVAQEAVPAMLAQGDLLGACSKRREADAESTRQDNYFTVYPNPVSDLMTVKFNSYLNSDYQIKMFDMTGRVVFLREGKALEDGISIVVVKLNVAKGIYILSLTSGDTVRQVQVVVD